MASRQRFGNLGIPRDVEHIFHIAWYLEIHLSRSACKFKKTMNLRKGEGRVGALNNGITWERFPNTEFTYLWMPTHTFKTWTWLRLTKREQRNGVGSFFIIYTWVCNHSQVGNE